MNEIFNPSRFGKYFVTDLKNCFTNFGMSLAVLGLSGVAFYILGGLLFWSMGADFGIPDGTLNFIFSIGIVIIVMIMPKKCYGHLTDRLAGPAFMLVPASTFEKFLSMVVNCIVVIPGAFALIFYGSEFLISLIDKGHRFSLAALSGSIMFDDIPINPFSAVDDIGGMIMIFLLGALCFKRHKTTYTLLCMIGLSIAMSMILLPVILNLISHDPYRIAEKFSSEYAWMDISYDLILLFACAAGVFFRLKTIKY